MPDGISYGGAFASVIVEVVGIGGAAVMGASGLIEAAALMGANYFNDNSKNEYAKMALMAIAVIAAIGTVIGGGLVGLSVAATYAPLSPALVILGTTLGGAITTIAQCIVFNKYAPQAESA